jgi:hypothetical protein
MKATEITKRYDDAWTDHDADTLVAVFIEGRSIAVHTTLGKLSVTDDIEAVLRKIEYWHQRSIAAFKIMYRDEHGVWNGIRCALFFALGETDEAASSLDRPCLGWLTTTAEQILIVQEFLAKELRHS